MADNDEGRWEYCTCLLRENEFSVPLADFSLILIDVKKEQILLSLFTVFPNIRFAISKLIFQWKTFSNPTIKFGLVTSQSIFRQGEDIRPISEVGTRLTGKTERIRSSTWKETMEVRKKQGRVCNKQRCDAVERAQTDISRFLIWPRFGRLSKLKFCSSRSVNGLAYLLQFDAYFLIMSSGKYLFWPWREENAWMEGQTYLLVIMQERIWEGTDRNREWRGRLQVRRVEREKEIRKKKRQEEKRKRKKKRKEEKRKRKKKDGCGLWLYPMFQSSRWEGNSCYKLEGRKNNPASQSGGIRRKAQR